MEKPSKEQLDEAIAREKEEVAKEVTEQEKDLEDVAGGAASSPATPAWKISYET